MSKSEPASFRCVHCAESLISLLAFTGDLAECPACKRTADPYLAVDNLYLTVDMLLLRRAVYIHLLWNAETSTSTRTVFRFALLAATLELYLGWTDTLLVEKEQSGANKVLLSQIIWTSLFYSLAFLLFNSVARVDLRRMLLAFAYAALPDQAILFVALVFRKGYIDSSADLRAIYDHITPLQSYFARQDFVLNAAGLRWLLVRVAVGATSAVIAISTLLENKDRNTRKMRVGISAALLVVAYGFAHWLHREVLRLLGT